MSFEDERRTKSTWKTSLIIIKRPERTYFSAHKKPFFIWEIIELAACPRQRENIGDSKFLFLWNETLQERLASQNSEERECGNKFGRGRNLLRPLGANPIYSAREGGNMKTLSVSLNSNLAWGSGAPTQKSNSLFSWFWLADWPNTWLWLALIGDQMHRQEGNMKTLQVRDTMIVMTRVLGFSSPIKIEMILVDVVIRPKLLR